jgi:hypothetical protein
MPDGGTDFLDTLLSARLLSCSRGSVSWPLWKDVAGSPKTVESETVTRPLARDADPLIHRLHHP